MRKVYDGLKEAFERQRHKASPLDLARLASRAFEAAIGTSSRAEDRVARALARGLAARQQLALEEGGSISSEETAHLLGISKTAVLKRRQAGRLLAWREERQGAIRFPIWQFGQGRVLHGLEAVLRILNRGQRLDDWGRVLFFLQTHGKLGDRRPLDCLREGNLRDVLLAAEAYVE
jgi:hypothetical protein